MIRYSSEVSIARPPHDVYEALLDPQMYERWTPMTETHLDAPARVGARGGFRMVSGPLKGLYTMEIAELEPDRRLVMKVGNAKMDWTAVSTLAPDGTGTRLTYAGEIQVRGLLRLLEPFMAGEAQRGEAKEAERLKSVLEAEGDAGRAAVPAAS